MFSGVWTNGPHSVIIATGIEGQAESAGMIVVAGPLKALPATGTVIGNKILWSADGILRGGTSELTPDGQQLLSSDGQRWQRKAGGIDGAWTSGRDTVVIATDGPHVLIAGKAGSRTGMGLSQQASDGRWLSFSDPASAGPFHGFAMDFVSLDGFRCSDGKEWKRQGARTTTFPTPAPYQPVLAQVQPEIAAVPQPVPAPHIPAVPSPQYWCQPHAALTTGGFVPTSFNGSWVSHGSTVRIEVLGESAEIYTDGGHFAQGRVNGQTIVWSGELAGATSTWRPDGSIQANDGSIWTPLSVFPAHQAQADGLPHHAVGAVPGLAQALMYQLAQMADMGFQHDASLVALQQARGDVEQAVLILTGSS